MKWRLIWRSLRTREMQKKILAVFAMIVVFRLLSQIPIPFAEPTQLRQVLGNIISNQDTPQILSFLNVLSGGAIQNFSIMLVGLGPFITASIIMQLLTKAFPRLERLQEDEGEYGRRKINQYTRILTLPLAIVQSIGTMFLVRQSANQFGGLGDILSGANLGRWTLMVAALTTGSMILMWLGEQLTEQGLGSGISLLVTVSVVSSLPSIAGQLIGGAVSEESKLKFFGKVLPLDGQGLAMALTILALTLLMILLVVYLNEAQRHITVSYAKRVQGNRTYGDVTSVLPVKLILAGVIPIIFALSFLSIPAFIGQLIKNSDSHFWSNLGNHLITLFQQPQAQSYLQSGWQPYLYPIAYFLLVFVFTFFYTSVTFNAKEITENLQKQGAFLGDIRPGKDTQKYLSKIVNRLTLFGAFSLGFLAVMPYILLILAVKFPSLPLPTNQIQIGGTSMLILVAVAIETLRQVESRALMLTYDNYSVTQGELTEHKAKNSKKKLIRFIKFKNKR